MSRTPLGYFKEPLTKEEIDLIHVPFLGNKNKNAQLLLFKKLEQEVNSYLRGCYGDMCFPDILNVGLERVTSDWARAAAKEYQNPEFLDPEKFWVKAGADGAVGVSNSLKLLSNGFYPRTIVSVTQEDVDLFFISFANSNLPLFGTLKRDDFRFNLNLMLTKYIDRQIESSEIGREKTLDHSVFIESLIEEIKKGG